MSLNYFKIWNYKLNMKFNIFVILSLIIFGSCSSNNINKNLDEYQEATNGEYLTLNGKITDVGPNSFSMSIDNEKILVEMDDFDYFKEGYQLKKGDKVMVFGMVDKDYLERRSLEASTVYVKNLKTHFFANSIDEEDYYTYTTYYISPQNSMNVLLRGRVLSISDDTITLSTGVDDIKVSTERMYFNPANNKNYIDLQENDYVEISGMITTKYNNNKLVQARTIKEL